MNAPKPVYHHPQTSAHQALVTHHDPWAHGAICCDQDHGASTSTYHTSSINPIESYCCDGDYCPGEHMDCDGVDGCCADPGCDEKGDACCEDFIGCHESCGDGGVKSLEEWADSKEGCHALQQLLECCNQPDCDIPVCPSDNSAIHPPPADPLAALFASMNAQPISPAPAVVDDNTSSIDFASHTCHWGNCHLVFKSMPDLLAHVAADHLSAWAVGQRPNQEISPIPQPVIPPPPLQPTPSSGPALSTPTNSQNFIENLQMETPLQPGTMSEHDRLLACLWDDCFPNTELPAALPDTLHTNSAVVHDHQHGHSHDHSTATGEPYSPGTMLRHVLEEHLGVPGEIIGWPNESELGNQQQVDEKYHHHHHVDAHHVEYHHLDSHHKAHLHDHLHYHQDQHDHHHHGHHHHHPLPTPPSTVRTDTSTSPTPTLTRQHICRWPGCPIETPFPDTASLMDHLSEIHIPKGQDSYVCHWDGCGGDGRLFKSRQKVLRHLQSHVAHKPFICGLCDQAFSEAAPLSAHMRRHAQEKPFKCEYPGCGKAFAISSSLTIHMRTHNGEKPFVCPHCQRGFIEASNLTKHIRTHTGERPFACAHSGCEKRFTRPDQLKRHMKVHDKPHDEYGSRRRSKVVL
ncbi:hypothetical protein IAR55_002520 [Kwoniella newhampshirensis]|uniref:C2H2-type domain-containing protein n=1 Tax=Kwoniella newhampshirensis TaxID=1651941 RepID=A0AAW0Z1Q1_9TREE